jgi:hypothetical protein
MTIEERSKCVGLLDCLIACNILWSFPVIVAKIVLLYALELLVLPLGMLFIYLNPKGRSVSLAAPKHVIPPEV